MPPYNATDPSATFLSSSCLDFLLIELVPLAHRVAGSRDGPAGSAGPGRAASSGSVLVRRADEDEELDAVHFRLESLGYRVGQGLVERCVRLPPPGCWSSSCG